MEQENRIKYENGDSYCGAVRNEKPEGKGVFTYYDGRSYEGTFRSGGFSGWGRFSWPNGGEYTGNFFCGHMIGWGTYRDSEGKKHSGLWLKGKRLLPKPDITAGDGWKPRTRGEAVFSGWHYVGDLVDGVADGYGVSEKDGNRYEGQFLRGMCWGKGIITMANGARYEGEFVGGKKYGFGKATFPDGEIYEGFWRDDRRNGKCV